VVEGGGGGGGGGHGGASEILTGAGARWDSRISRRPVEEESVGCWVVEPS
jgi:hypothetical protein